MRLVRTFTTLASFTFLAFSVPTRADPLIVDFTESFAADWHWVLDDPQLAPPSNQNVVDLRNRLNARLRWGTLTLGVRLDVAAFPNAPSPQYANDIRPEELFLSYRDRTWTLTAGDDYVTLGRGLTLSLRKFDEVGFSVNLRGAHVRFRTPGVEIRFNTGFSNVVNVDAIDEKRVPDPADLIAAARVQLDRLGPLTLGVNVVDIERRNSPLRNALTSPLYGDLSSDPSDPGYRIQGRRELRTFIAGGDLHARLWDDQVEVHLEGAWLRNVATREGLTGDTSANTDGLALYGSATALLGPWNVLLEAKHYDHWRVSSSLHPDTADAQGITQVFPYVSPPSLERNDQVVTNNTDASGVHLRIDRTLGARSAERRDTLFLSAAFFVDAPAEHEWTLHSYLGWEHTESDGTRFTLQSGYRREEAPHASPSGGGITRLSMWHIDLDWTRTLAKNLDLQLHWDNKVKLVNGGIAALEETSLEGTFYATLSVAPSWAFTLQTEYLTAKTESNPMFFGGFIQWKPSSADLVRVFIGRSKGGLKCSGGVCRMFPNFEGIKLEAVLRF